MEKLSYSEAVRWISELPLYTKKNELPQLKAFYEWLGAPGSGSRIIHVAGTNGKGSVCAYLNSVLTCAGYRAGLFTSPHLVQLRERFVENGDRIGEAAFAKLTAAFLEKLEKYGDGKWKTTFFETLFFLFMLWMEEKKPDFILLETGMGGRQDVTNVIEPPFITAITKIALDHCAYLGNSLEEIAEEKAGIMKARVPAVCWETDDAVSAVFQKRARELSVPLTLVSEKEVAFSKTGKNKIDFFMQSAYDRDIKAVLHTQALYQACNAAIAVRVLEIAGQSVPLDRKAMKEGLERMRWEARMEEIRPGVYLDGGHNPDGIRAFLESVAADGCRGRRYLLFGALSDKSAAEMFSLLDKSGLFWGAALTGIKSGRSLNRQELEAFACSMNVSGRRALVFEDVSGAYGYLTQEKKEQDRIYIAGSLYLAGEIKCCLETDMEVSHDKF